MLWTMLGKTRSQVGQSVGRVPDEIPLLAGFVLDKKW
jgi:hypothetical protein